jgi:hypothetical protein
MNLPYGFPERLLMAANIVLIAVPQRLLVSRPAVCYSGVVHRPNRKLTDALFSPRTANTHQRASNRPCPWCGRDWACGETLCPRVERSLYERANGYNYDAVKIFMPAGAKQPVIVHYVEHCPPDVGAAFIWLKNRDPERWRDVQNVEHVMGRYIISDRPMTPEQWAAERATIIDDVVEELPARDEYGLQVDTPSLPSPRVSRTPTGRSK